MNTPKLGRIIFKDGKVNWLISTPGYKNPKTIG
jgi:hypothetical protein